MAGSEHHAFGYAKLHFAWGQVGHHDREFADQVVGLVNAGNATENIAMFAFAHIQSQAQEFGRALNGFTLNDLGNAQIDLGKVVDRDGGCNGFATRQWHSFHHRFRGFKQGVKHGHIDSLHQVLVVVDGMACAQ